MSERWEHKPLTEERKETIRSHPKFRRAVRANAIFQRALHSPEVTDTSTTTFQKYDRAGRLSQSIGREIFEDVGGLDAGYNMHDIHDVREEATFELDESLREITQTPSPMRAGYLASLRDHLR